MTVAEGAGKLFLLPTEISPGLERRIGGKARGLLRLERAGLPVPPWCVLPFSTVEERPWRSSVRLRETLAQLDRQFGRAPFAGLFVRSSAGVEDSARASFAGLFASSGVRSPEHLVPALERVADSASSPRVASYARRQGLAEPISMAIVVQSRLRPRLSGVLFSAHPAKGLPRRGFLEVVRGGGSGLVAGRREPSCCDLELDSRRGVDFVHGADGPDALAAGLLRSLVAYLLRAEEELETLLDVEWALDAQGLWFLQARPLTTLRADETLYPSACATSWFFDQRFVEPIHPLTRTTLVPRILRHAIEEPLLMLKRSPHELPAALFAGQIYVAHRTFRRLLGPVPRGLLTPDLRQLFPPQCACRPGREEERSAGSRRRYLVAALAALTRHGQESVFNIRSWQRFKDALPGKLAQLPPATDLRPEGWRARWHQLEKLNEEFLRLHRWSIILADYLFQGCRWLLGRLPAARRERLEDRLLRAVRLPTTAANAKLEEILADGDPPAEEVRDFVARFGHRSAALDYAVPTWGELLEEKWGPVSAEPPAEPGEERRGSAPPARRPLLFRPLIRLLEMREEQRFEWERILYEQRKMLLAAGRTLTSRGALGSPQEVWFLEWEELLSSLFEQRPVDREELRLRQHEWRFDQLLERPAFIGPHRVRPDLSRRRLRGLGASRGTASGRVHVLAPSTRLGFEVPAGRILVATTLEPAMTVLLPRVRGAVLERGGILSHAAILAREYGVPLVVGVEAATATLTDGVAVTVDGTHGWVTVHEDEDDDECC